VRAMVNQIAQLYRKAKQTPAAYTRLAKLSDRHQQIPAVRHAAATAEIELAIGERDYARANPAVQRLLVDPNRDQLPAGSLAALGNAFLKTDRFDQALEIFQQMRARFANDPRSVALATVGTGQAQFGLRRYDEAAQAYQAVTAMGADAPGTALPEAELGLGKVYLAQAAGRSVQDPVNVKAVELLTRVLAGSRGELAGEASFRLGQFFFGQRADPQKGKENCKTALAYFLRVALLTGGPMGEEAAFRSAQCHECLGNTEAARSAYTAYLRRFAAGAFAQDAQTQLAALPPPKS
jgi:tetratricopeptide (TPR) repeat protein